MMWESNLSLCCENTTGRDSEDNVMEDCHKALTQESLCMVQTVCWDSGKDSQAIVLLYITAGTKCV